MNNKRHHAVNKIPQMIGLHYVLEWFQNWITILLKPVGIVFIIKIDVLLFY